MKEELSAGYVKDTLIILATVSGLILTLMWTLLDLPNPSVVIFWVRLATILLALCVVASLLGLQFLITETIRRENGIRQNKQGPPKSLADEYSIRFAFLAAWILFLAGAFVLVIAIWHVN